MFGLGVTELLIILVIVLIIFGVGKLPQLGSALGEGLKNFKKAVGQEEDEDKPKELKDENSSEDNRK